MSKKYSRLIKYKCTNCEHIEPFTRKEYFKNLFLKNIALFLALTGLLFIILLSIIGPITAMQSLYTPFYLANSNFDGVEIRRIAANATTICDEYGYNTDALCHSIALFEQLDEIRYLPSNHWDFISSAEDTYLYGGDCKDVSTLFVGMMKSIGFDSRIDCNIQKQHCVAVVPYITYNNIYMNQNIVVDLTIPGLYLLDEEYDIWTYQYNGLKITESIRKIINDSIIV